MGTYHTKSVDGRVVAPFIPAELLLLLLFVVVVMVLSLHVFNRSDLSARGDFFQ